MMAQTKWSWPIQGGITLTVVTNGKFVACDGCKHGGTTENIHQVCAKCDKIYTFDKPTADYFGLKVSILGKR